MSRLDTPLASLLGVRFPIVQAPMANVQPPGLAAAVSNAGGLGTIGSLGRTPDDLRNEIQRCRSETQQPFAVNVVTFQWAPFADELLEVVLAEQVPAVTLSFNLAPGASLDAALAAAYDAASEVVPPEEIGRASCRERV